MQRQVLSTYSLVLARKINSSYFKVVPGGVQWTPGQETTGISGRTCNLRTLAMSNNSATVIALNPIKITTTTNSNSRVDKKKEVLSSEDNVVLEDQPKSTDEDNGDSRKFRPVIPTPAAVLDASIQQEKSVQALLTLSSNSALTLRGACQIIFRLGQLAQDKDKNLSGSTIGIETDERFKLICKIVQKGNHSQVPHSLLQAIRGLQNLGLSSDGNLLVQELEHELKWSMRRCPVRFLARAIDTLSTGRIIAESSGPSENSQTSRGIGTQDPLYIAIQTLQRRWTEVSTGGEFLTLFKIVNHLSAETREKLEDRAVELVQDFSPIEMVKMFIALANSKRRPTPLLRALAFHLSKSTEKVPVKDLVELIYALNELTFADPVLMQKICSDLQSEVESVTNPSWISSLATSLGRMRYMHKELMESLQEWISNHLDELRPFDCASWLLASSVFYLNSTKQEAFFAKAKLKLSQKAVVNPVEWLNIVHALVILGQAPSDLVSSVLKPEFVKQIDSLNESNSTARLKLLNVNAVAKGGVSSKTYDAPQLPKEFVTKWSASTGENDLHLSKIVLESLSNFLPPPKYLRSGVKTESGVFIDAVCLLNEKTDPVPVDSSNIKGAIKVAIVVQGYPVMCLGMKVPTGSSVLNVKLLQSEGYEVICVPYMEFSPKEKILRRVQYLEQKVRNVNANPSMRETTNVQLRNTPDASANVKR